MGLGANLAANLGRRVTDLRERLGHRIDEVAAEAGLSRSGLWYIEHGRINTKIDVLERLVVVLGVDAADLFTFPWTRYPRHRARDLIRLTPENQIDGLVAAMEEYLQRQEVLVMRSKKHRK
jgi:transcriptional regulator with XRE-family HTH domain